MNSRIAISRLLPISAAIVAMLSSHVSAGDSVVDKALGFTLRLPDGFVANPDLVGAAPNIVHGFVLGDPTDDEQDIVLFIEDMRGIIGRERLSPKDMPPGFQGRLFTIQWQGFDVDAFAVPEQFGEIKTITYNVQIPLKRSAIQVRLVGIADRDSELKVLLAETLAGLEGESNWIRSAMPVPGLASSEKYGSVLLAFTIVFIVGGVVALWLIARRTPKGTVLAIAAAMYVASWALSGIRVREVLMLVGLLRMLGFAGGILGILDLLRKRKPRDQNSS